MEAVLRYHDGGGGDAFIVAVETRQLDGRLVGLGPGVAEERPVHAAETGEAFRQLLLLDDAVEVGGMYQEAGLLTQRLGHRRMGMAQPAYRHAADGVQVFITRRVPQPCPFAAFEADRESRISRHQCL